MEITDKTEESLFSANDCVVFVSEIPSEIEIGKVFSDERNAEIASCRNENLKKARYTDWKLLEYAANRVFEIAPERLIFKKTQNGKWVCDKFFFSLSHTDKNVAVAVSPAPCGVDIENIARGIKYDIKTLEKMRKYTFSEEENTRVEKSSLEFLKIWTAKESIFKAYGEQSFYPKKTDTLAKNHATYVFEQRDIVLSLCGENSDSAKIVFVEPRNGSFSEIPAEKQ